MAGADDVTANYTLKTKTPGSLDITKSEIAQYVTLTPVDVVETYDGAAHAAGVATAADANGKAVKVEYSVNGTDWTTDPASITATAVADSVTVNVRASVESSYEGYVTGTQKLTITAKAYGINTASDSKEYDGTPLTNKNAEVAGLVAKDTAYVEGTGEITDKGEVPNSAGDVNWASGTDERNYIHDTSLDGIGVLTVTAKKIDPTPTPTPEDPDAVEHKLTLQGLENVTYNGSSQPQHEKIVVKDGDKKLVEGKDYELRWSSDTTNVGTVRVTVVGKGNYDGEDWAEYQIMHFPVTVTANGAGKTYGTGRSGPHGHGQPEAQRRL